MGQAAVGQDSPGQDAQRTRGARARTRCDPRTGAAARKLPTLLVQRCAAPGIQWPMSGTCRNQWFDLFSLPVVPNGSQCFTSGSPVVPDGSVVPSGSPVVPSGSPVVPSGCLVVPSTDRNWTDWTDRNRTGRTGLDRSDIRGAEASHHGSWIKDHGSKIKDQRSWIKDHGSWIMDQRSWIMDQGSWTLDLVLA